MRVAVITQYYYPEDFLITDICQELVCLGHIVDVYTGIPNYPSGRYAEGYGIFRRRHEIVNGVEVFRCFQFPRGNTRCQLLINYISYPISSSLRIINNRKYDRILCYQLTPIIQALAAILLKWRLRTELHLYCLDLAPLSGEQLLKGNSFLKSAYSFISKMIYMKCDHVAVTTKSFIEYLNNVHGVDKERITYIPQFSSDIELGVEQRRSTPSKGVSFLFAGNLGEGLAFENVLFAAALLKKKGYCFHLHIVGGGRCLDDLRKLTGSLALNEQVTFYGQVKTAEMPNYFSLADVLLLTLRKGNMTLPRKLITYLAVGKAVVASLEGSARDIIEEAKCGICVPPEDIEEMSQAMLHFIDNPEECLRVGKRGREYFASHFTKEVFIKKFVSWLSLP